MRIDKSIRISQIISFAICAALFIVSLFLLNTPAKESYIYRDNRILSFSWRNIYERIVGIILALVTLFSIISIIINIKYKLKENKKVFKSTLRIILLTVINTIMLFIGYILVVGLWTKDAYEPKCYMFTDNNHTIVIEEESFLLYGGGTIYQIKDNNEAVVIGKISTDDGGRNYGDYDIKWYDDCAEIVYNTFTSGDSRATEKVRFED